MSPPKKRKYPSGAAKGRKKKKRKEDAKRQAGMFGSICLCKLARLPRFSYCIDTSSYCVLAGYCCCLVELRPAVGQRT